MLITLINLHFFNAVPALLREFELLVKESLIVAQLCVVHIRVEAIDVLQNNRYLRVSALHLCVDFLKEGLLRRRSRR